jgi:bifunctional non-homologous end joining protein LigD
MADPLKALAPEQRKRVRRTRQPAWVDPMLATLTNQYFSDPDWIFEPKLDGIRCLAFKKDARVTMLSRNKLDLSAAYPTVMKALQSQSGDFIIDGEIAAVVGDKTSFSMLQQARRAAVPLVYFVFDVMHVEGLDVRKVDLLGRKAVLAKALRWKEPLRLVTHVVEEGETYFAEACKRGWEGLIAKRAASVYVGGRSRDWLKFKCSNEQEFVIIGYTDPQGSRVGFGAILVGYYEGDELRYAGKVGTGFDQRTLLDLMKLMKPLERAEPPFPGKPPIRKGVHWLRPKLVAQIGFAEWTPDGRLRHPRYLGLRRDKKAKEVVRERA